MSAAGVPPVRNTEHKFYDVQAAKQSCITFEMMAGWNRRATAEVAAKSVTIKQDEKKFFDGQITFEVYQKLLALADTQIFAGGRDADGVEVSVEEWGTIRRARRTDNHQSSVVKPRSSGISRSIYENAGNR